MSQWWSSQMGPDGVGLLRMRRFDGRFARQVRPVRLEYIAEEFPIANDSERVNWIINTYSVIRDSQGRSLQCVVPPYDCTGYRQVYRGQVNQRKQTATTLKYARSLLGNGLVRGVRGNAFMVLSENNRPR